MEAPTLSAWAVGTIDNFDWRHVNASTVEEAKRIWLCDEGIRQVCDQPGRAGCDCEHCYTTANLLVERKPEWDGKEEATRADWIRAEMGACCSRCGEETYGIGDDPGHAVGDEAVCHECMTLADWDVVDPDKAAELREEMAEDDAA